MKAHFYDLHEGIKGARYPLPEPFAIIGRRWDDQVGDPDELVAELQAVTDDCKVTQQPPGMRSCGSPCNFGTVDLRMPALGYPASMWLVLKYDIVE